MWLTYEEMGRAQLLLFAFLLVALAAINVFMNVRKVPLFMQRSTSTVVHQVPGESEAVATVEGVFIHGTALPVQPHRKTYFPVFIRRGTHSYRDATRAARAAAIVSSAVTICSIRERQVF